MTRIPDEIPSTVDRALFTLEEWVRRRDYAGYEPFDILSSPLLRGEWARWRPFAIPLIQFGKRYAGLRLRRCMCVPPSKNPKALGLFLSAYCDLARCGYDTQRGALYLKSELKRLRSPSEPEYCWGYDWDFASRGGLMPAFSPNCIATCFCAHALLDMAEVFGDADARRMAQSAGRFLITRLNRPVDTPEYLCLSYTPRDHMKVYNASAHSGALLARLAPSDPEYSQIARRTMSYLVADQQPNGAWYYGPALVHRWIDSFHTAYNIGALLAYQQCTRDTTFAGAVQLGYEYYLSNFFNADGAVKYYHNSLYPIDIHSCSQAILTFCDFSDRDKNARERAFSVTRWTLEHMRGTNGTFFFRTNRFWTNRTPYMRWGQAWMLHALARLKRQYLYPNALRSDQMNFRCSPKPALEAAAANSYTAYVNQRNSC